MRTRTRANPISETIWALAALAALVLAAADVTMTVHAIVVALDPAANTLNRIFAACGVAFVAPTVFAGSLVSAAVSASKIQAVRRMTRPDRRF